MSKIFGIGIIVFIFLAIFAVEVVLLCEKLKLWVALLISLGTFAIAFGIIGLTYLGTILMLKGENDE